jgi:hypothetical protein
MLDPADNFLDGKAPASLYREHYAECVDLLGGDMFGNKMGLLDIVYPDEVETPSYGVIQEGANTVDKFILEAPSHLQSGSLEQADCELTSNPIA